ncbi:uncharacterized protein A4U43_UnF8890 [Asparagus officinalis]|uniref:Uncharacterized protein n=1 Tax=Asparagus officinalis TaxID=4686 RepID=A0A1R3L5U7_ASPOF|nr:uncharacterized protein A4U43_UnF8890 [Asparagus officinalis]
MAYCSSSFLTYFVLILFFVLLNCSQGVNTPAAAPTIDDDPVNKLPSAYFVLIPILVVFAFFLFFITGVILSSVRHRRRQHPAIELPPVMAAVNPLQRLHLGPQLQNPQAHTRSPQPGSQTPASRHLEQAQHRAFGPDTPVVPAARFRLDNLGPQPGSKKKAKRKGRGIAAGQGNSCGFGMRGQKSRSGPGVRKGFEGGQMPLYRRLPKLRRSLEVIN